MPDSEAPSPHTTGTANLTLLDTIIVFLGAATLLLFLFWFAGAISNQAVFETVPAYWGTVGNRIWAWITGGAVGSVLVYVLRRQYAREVPSPPYIWYMLGMAVLLWIAVLVATVTLDKVRVKARGDAAEAATDSTSSQPSAMGPVGTVAVDSFRSQGVDTPVKSKGAEPPLAVTATPRSDALPSDTPEASLPAPFNQDSGGLESLNAEVIGCERTAVDFVRCELRLRNAGAKGLSVALISRPSRLIDESGADHFGYSSSIAGSAPADTSERMLTSNISTAATLSFKRIPATSANIQLLEVQARINNVVRALQFRNIPIRAFDPSGGFRSEMP